MTYFAIILTMKTPKNGTNGGIDNPQVDDLLWDFGAGKSHDEAAGKSHATTTRWKAWRKQTNILSSSSMKRGLKKNPASKKTTTTRAKEARAVGAKPLATQSLRLVLSISQTT